DGRRHSHAAHAAADRGKQLPVAHRPRPDEGKRVRTIGVPRERLIVLALLAAIAMAAFDAHCSSEATLTVAIHRGVESEALGVLANDFAQEHHTSVELVDLPYDELYEAEMREVS